MFPIDPQLTRYGSCLVDAYVARVGYRGDTSPTLQTLCSMHALHSAAIPFENIDVLLKKRISLDLPALFKKIVEGKRGGYCFEQNLLFGAVLQSLGMQVTAIGARPLWNVPAGPNSPRTHMLLCVRFLDDTYIADVGYGRLTLSQPLRLELGAEQQTSHGTYRVIPADSEFQLQALLEATWTSLYQFSLAEQLLSDLEVANWYTSTHPNSIFTNKLVVSRIVGERRYALLDKRLSIYLGQLLTDRRSFITADTLRLALCDCFGIDPSVAASVAGLVKPAATQER
jgi:N-hydroxyarylamine O-acetyltransferase